ncbi:MAG: hypothetical protein FWG10_06140 [Eubacteriaceae bacterium]|nr:hypothetical protein [Eubacteriaceae bacterium]
MKNIIFKTSKLAFAFVLATRIASCSSSSAGKGGGKEAVNCHARMLIDITNPSEVVWSCDYVFIGHAEKLEGVHTQVVYILSGIRDECLR